MNREIHITDLIPFLKNSHVKLELTFLKCLLIDASKTELPHYNLDFCNYLGCKINKNNKKSSNIYQWLKGERTIPFKKLIKIVSLAKNYKWDDVEKNLISIKSGIKKGEIYPKFPFYLDEKFGCIIGHILGDGSISRTYEISFNFNAPSNAVPKLYFLPIYKKLLKFLYCSAIAFTVLLLCINT